MARPCLGAQQSCVYPLLWQGPRRSGTQSHECHKAVTFPKDDSQEERRDLEWLCVGVAMRAGGGDGVYNHERSGSCRVPAWVQTADAEAVRTDLPEQREEWRP